MSLSPAQPSLPRVVIVGAGFGGLTAAKALSGAPFSVTVVDRRNYHLFQPLLYQVATAGLSPADIAAPIRGILRGSNASVHLAKVTGIDPKEQTVMTDRGTLPYDHLIIATGARHAYFGHDEWESAAPGLKKIEDATEIRRRILIAFERAETETDETERRRLLTFVIVGGGATGVEMAGAIAELAKRALAADFRSIDPRDARIVLVEAGPRLLPAFDASLSEYAKKALEGLGAEVILNRAVTACDALRRRRRRRTDREPHGDLGRGRARFAGGEMARRRDRPRRARDRQSGPFRPRLSEHIRDRRYGACEGRERRSASRRRDRRQAARKVRREAPRIPGARERCAALPLSRSGLHGDDRTKPRCGTDQWFEAHRAPRLAALVARARLLPDRVQEPPRRASELGVELSHLRARHTPYHRLRRRGGAAGKDRTSPMRDAA